MFANHYGKEKTTTTKQIRSKQGTGESAKKPFHKVASLHPCMGEMKLRKPNQMSRGGRNENPWGGRGIARRRPGGRIQSPPAEHIAKLVGPSER